MMKFLIVNGSPRMNGNTKSALNAAADGIRLNKPDDSVEFLDVAKHKISGCSACSACQGNGGKCVMPDASAELVGKVDEADAVIIGTPVYWWGMSAQLKMLIDKFYSRCAQFQQEKKSIGVIVIGAAGQEESQYRIIREQFECIAAYLGWDFKFCLTASAAEAGEICKNKDFMRSCDEIWRNF